ncbi:MAG: YihY/virulence factor BrkB family protein [Acidobacteriota bacterium]
MELFGGQGWRVFANKLYEKVVETDVMSRAAQIAFYFSFAFFPLLFFLITLFGLVLNKTNSLQAELYQYLGQIMPGSAFDLVQKTLAEIVEASSGGKLTFGLLVTLWSASAGVDSIRNTLNSVYELKESRSWWSTKLQSLVLTLGFIILIAVALAGVTAGWTLVQLGFGSIGLEVTSPWVLVTVQWVALLLVMLLATAIVYSWVPCFDKFRWVWISPGAVVAILLWIILSGAFRTYLHYFNSYNKAYGSLGAVIVLMLWMYLTGLAILLGGAINSTLTEMTEGDVSPEDKK